MNFQLAPLDISQFAATYAGLDEDSAFANVFSREFNRIRHEDGRLIVLAGGQEVQKATALHVVIAAFQHDDFNKARRQWYAGTWSKTQEAGKKPDCQSFDGVAPDVGAAMPQHATCAGCPNSGKNSDGYTACSYRKNFIMYLCKVDPATGQSVVDTDTPYVFDASSMSMYAEYEQTTQSGGTHRIIPLLRKSGVTVTEAVVFELGFHQGSKAPTIKPVGAVPADTARSIIAAAKLESTRALLAPIGVKAAPALAAPAAQVQLAAPVQPVVEQPVAQAQQAAPEPVQQSSPFVAQQPQQQAWAPAVTQAAPEPVQQPVAQTQQPVQHTATSPVATLAPSGNRAKALGSFSAMIGSK